LREIGRVLDASGAFFVTVPDAGTLTDLIYRFLACGGGHVNKFRSQAEVISIVTRQTGLPFYGRRTLFTSLSFLHPENRKGKRSVRLLLLFGAGERTLRVGTWLFRLIDRLAGTRLSIYGWAFYFGTIRGPIAELPWTNVCVWGAGPAIRPTG